MKCYSRFYLVGMFRNKKNSNGDIFIFFGCRIENQKKLHTKRWKTQLFFHSRFYLYFINKKE